MKTESEIKKAKMALAKAILKAEISSDYFNTLSGMLVTLGWITETPGCISLQMILDGEQVQTQSNPTVYDIPGTELH